MMVPMDVQTASAALDRIKNGSVSVLDAAWCNMLSPYEIDTEDADAMRQLLAAIVTAALDESQN